MHTARIQHCRPQTQHNCHQGYFRHHHQHDYNLQVVLATVSVGGAAPDPRVEEWKYAAQCQGWSDVRVLGEAETWNGFRTKTTCFLRLCESLPAGTLLVATDAYDLLICGSEEELVTKFLCIGKDTPPGNQVFI